MSLIIINKETGKELSQRKLETYDRYNRVIQWGRRNTVEFIRRFMGLELLDFQKFIITNTWPAQFAVWNVCRNGSKTSTAGIYTMARSLLIPFNVTYFLGNTGEQAKEVFTKMEKIAKCEIESFVGSTDVFINEIKINSVNGDGFTHSPASFNVELFNSSEIFTLNSDVINIKGKRGNVTFDEHAWFNSELTVQAEQFANQDENFKLGVDLNTDLDPKNFPRQLVYASSASDTDSDFYKKLRDYTAKMMMGNRSYFTCNFTIDSVLKATVGGKPIKTPLISRDKVERALSDNLEKAQRELYNNFTSGAHEGQILTSRIIREHTKQYTPIMFNENGIYQFLFSWDPARLNDNSVIIVAQLINDLEIGWRMRLATVRSLVDQETKNKTPMGYKEQVAEFQKMLLLYNGTEYGKLDYENIDSVVGDAGAAGQMTGAICDSLLDDWMGKDGKRHKGLIDPVHKGYASKTYNYPNAVEKMILVDPRSSRNEIFESIETMVKLGVVEFPCDYDLGRDYVEFIDTDGNKERHDLTDDEMVALANIELLKTEITTMCKYTNKGQVTFDFPPDKRNRMHDDRVFAFGLLCWRLAQLRRGQVINKPKPPIDPNSVQTFATAVSFD